MLDLGEIMNRMVFATASHFHPSLTFTGKAGACIRVDWVTYFVQLGLNFSNGVTDTLESSSILIYFVHVKDISTRQNVLIKTELMKYKRKHHGKLH